MTPAERRQWAVAAVERALGAEYCETRDCRDLAEHRVASYAAAKTSETVTVSPACSSAPLDVEGFRRAYWLEADCSPADHAPVTE
jgi:hypothetical protein